MEGPWDDFIEGPSVVIDELDQAEEDREALDTHLNLVFENYFIHVTETRTRIELANILAKLPSLHLLKLAAAAADAAAKQCPAAPSMYGRGRPQTYKKKSDEPYVPAPRGKDTVSCDLHIKQKRKCPRGGPTCQWF